MKTFNGESAIRYLPFVTRFIGRSDVTLCASYSIPDQLVATPGVAENLVSAYQDCDYIIDFHGGRVAVRVGEQSADVQRMLSALAVEAAYYITAANPFSVRPEASSNELQHELLEIELKHAGAMVFPATSGAGTRGEESGFVVAGLELCAIQDLAIEFGQNAVVKISTGAPAELLLMR